MSDSELPRRARGNDLMRDHGYLVAAVVGIVLVVAGVALAANSKPESALVWTGGILLVVAVIGERLASAELGREGAKITTREKVAELERVIDSVPESAPKLPTIRLTPASGLESYHIGGSYWSQPAMDTLVTAYGSNTRPEFERAVGRLEDQIARGTAVVKIADSDAENATGDLDE